MKTESEAKEWADRACNLQHDLNVALRERDQARFELQAARKSLQDHAELALADAGLLREAMEALGACRKKGARWHPCDPVATASDAAIAALRKRLGE